MIKMITIGGGKVWYNSDVRDIDVVDCVSELYWHRLDGPACERNNGMHSWYINDDMYYNFKEFQKAGNLSDEQMCILRIKYGEI